MCGVLGIISHEGVIGDLHDGMLTLQHRGQDAAGIITYSGQFHVKKGKGLIQEIFNEKNLLRLKGNIGIGHIRYTTVGLNEAEDIQPFFVNAPHGIAMCHNGNLTNYHALKEHLTKIHRRHINSGCDVEVILNVFADELARNDSSDPIEDIFKSVKKVFETIKGAYSVVTMIAGVGLVAFRDPFGIRPLIMGERRTNGRPEYAFASESVALDILSFNDRQDVQNGECIIVDFHGKIHRKIIDQKPHHPCMFEYIYFARPDSLIDKISVYKTRVRLGEYLADLWASNGIEPDKIMPIPDSSRSATVAMSRRLHRKYSEGFVKNRYIGRYFIMPSQKKRAETLKHKLNPVRIEFEGSDVLLVDDSIVRGSTSKKIINAARRAGARKVYFASTSPPIISPCVYGVDMSTKKELVASQKSIEEIKEHIGADELIYQRVDDMVEAARRGNPDIKNFCTACFTGKYPTSDITPEMFKSIEDDREKFLACGKDD